MVPEGLLVPASGSGSQLRLAGLQRQQLLSQDQTSGAVVGKVKVERGRLLVVFCRCCMRRAQIVPLPRQLGIHPSSPLEYCRTFLR